MESLGLPLLLLHPELLLAGSTDGWWHPQLGQPYLLKLRNSP